MKKLKLNPQQLKGAEVLTRSQLKQILGGEEAVLALCSIVPALRAPVLEIGMQHTAPPRK